MNTASYGVSDLAKLPCAGATVRQCDNVTLEFFACGPHADQLLQRSRTDHHQVVIRNTTDVVIRRNRRQSVEGRPLSRVQGLVIVVTVVIRTPYIDSALFLPPH
jgi:hypothetical protein